MAAFVGLTGIKEMCVLRRRRGITGGGETLSSGLWQTPLSPRPRCDVDNCPWFGDEAVAALAAHCPLLWNFSALVTLDPYDSDDDIGAYRLTTPTRRWLYQHVSCWGSDKKPPGRLNMKEALVRYSPAPWDIIR